MSVTNDIQMGAHDVNRTDVEGGLLLVLWLPSEAFSLKLNSVRQDSKIEGFPYVDQGLGDLEQTDLRGTGAYNVSARAYSLTAHVKVGNGELTAISGYTTYTSNGFNDFTYALGTATQTLFGVGGVALDNPRRARKIPDMRALLPSGSNNPVANYPSQPRAIGAGLARTF